jgi:hypothetical protein
MWSYYRLADSFSKRNDSIKASEHFLKINPFLFISEENATPNTLDTIFSSFALTAQARKQYKKIFDSVYRKPRTKTYKLFAKMLKADQEVRHRLDSIQNETSEKLPPEFLNKVDSPHFEYQRMAYYRERFFTGKHYSPARSPAAWVLPTHSAAGSAGRNL